MEEKSFINREEELNLLAESVKKPGHELIVVYGRRRIGKSRLLEELKKKVRIDLSIMLEEADYWTNLNIVSEAIAKKYNYPSFHPKSFREAFENIPENSVIIIDEFSYIKEFGEFQTIWESISKKKKHKLILCGSLIRTMEDLTYSLKSPLYGRATQVIKLMPLKFKHVVEWYKNKAMQDIIPVYAGVGGIPRYLELIENPALLKEAFFSKNSILLREGKLLLKESFPTSEIYPKIMFEISGGETEATKIANAINLPATQISKYLSLLVDYGFVEKRMPLFGGGKKDVRFYMADSFFAFWTLFVWPHYGEIESGMFAHANEKYVQKINSFLGMQFEKVCQEVLAYGGFKTGKQWGGTKERNYEIDLAGIKNKEVILGECKWQEGVNAEKTVKELAEKAKLAGINSNYAVFAKSFNRRIVEFEGKKVSCYDLKDIEKIVRR